MLDSLDDSWIGSIKPVFKYFEERTPGTVTETQESSTPNPNSSPNPNPYPKPNPNQESSITWHYREADEDFGEIQASDLQMHLERVLSNQPVEISLDAKQVHVPHPPPQPHPHPHPHPHPNLNPQLHPCPGARAPVRGLQGRGARAHTRGVHLVHARLRGEAPPPTPTLTLTLT